MALSDALWERVWTMGRCFGKVRRDFKNGLARLGAFQTQQVEGSADFWHGMAARNVLVDELITGTQFRQVVELGLQAAGAVAGPADPRSRVGYGDHRPVFEQWPVPLGGTQFEGENSR